MQKALDHTAKEFSGLHTGKASPSMVETVTVEAYGSSMKINEMAAIMTPDARTITIQPWDKSTMPAIEKAILAANIGLTPAAQGDVIRCPIPEMSKERRKELVKVAGGLAEDGRIGMRARVKTQWTHSKKPKKTVKFLKTN